MPSPLPSTQKKRSPVWLLYLCEDLSLMYVVRNGGNTDFIIFLLAFYWLLPLRLVESFCKERCRVQICYFSHFWLVHSLGIVFPSAHCLKVCYSVPNILHTSRNSDSLFLISESLDHLLHVLACLPSWNGLVKAFGFDVLARVRVCCKIRLFPVSSQ